jgi:hypothetical protein
VEGTLSCPLRISPGRSPAMHVQRKSLERRNEVSCCWAVQDGLRREDLKGPCMNQAKLDLALIYNNPVRYSPPHNLMQKQQCNLIRLSRVGQGSPLCCRNSWAIAVCIHVNLRSNYAACHLSALSRSCSRACSICILVLSCLTAFRHPRGVGRS